MATQKALLLTAKQGSLSLQQRPIPSPRPSQILVKIQATALNPVDWKIREHGLFLESYPAVLGNDMAGTVVQLGDGVTGWKVGDRVLFEGSIYENDTQGFQQYAVVDARMAAQIPDNLSFSAASTIPLGLATAVFGLWGPAPVGLGLAHSFDGTPRSQGPALVVGGATTVGQFAIQILRISGFSPIIAYASGKHSNFLKSLGATHIIDRTTTPLQSLSQAVQTAYSGAVSVVYDTVSIEETQNAAYQVVPSGGHLLTVLPEVVKEKVAGRNVQHIIGCWFLGGAHQEFGYELYKHVGKLVSSGAIVPTAFEELPGGLRGVPEGLDRLKEDKVSGKKLVALPQETA